MKKLIIGYGIVGKNIHKLFPDADIYDCNGNNTKKNIIYDVAFVCVPTDKKKDGSCDTSIVEECVYEHQASVFVIKSTVPPGTTQKLNRAGINCIFSPEYFGATQHANGGDYNFVILGGRHDLCDIAAEAYKEKMTGSFKIVYTDTKTAELCKYMENAFLAMKVSFCNEFARIADAFSVNYNELRELFIMDSRVNPSHTFVYKDHPYYDSHCLNKDIPGIIRASEQAGHRTKLLEAMHEINSLYKR
jgi:UDPglucose 6-dehydrogenase